MHQQIGTKGLSYTSCKTPSETILAFTAHDKYSNKPINHYRWEDYSQSMNGGTTTFMGVQTSTTGGLFGQSKPMFSSQSTGSTTFGQNKPSLFSSQSTSTFGQQKPTLGFGQTQTTTGFGQTQPTTGFGQTQPTTGFGQTQPTTSFGQTQPTTGFGQTQSTCSLFGQSNPLLSNISTDFAAVEKNEPLFSHSNNTFEQTKGFGQIISSNSEVKNFIPIETISLLHLIEDQLTNIRDYERPKYSDYIINVKDRTFYLHKFILIIRCSELLDENVTHKLSSFSLKAIIIALKYIYGGQLRLAENRNMESLQELCSLFKLLKISTAYHYITQLINNKIKKYDDVEYINEYEKWLNSEEYDIIELFFNEMKYRKSIDVKVKTKMYLLSRNNKEFIKKHEDHLEKYIQHILELNISFENEFKSSILLLEKSKPYSDIIYKFENDLVKAHKAILYNRCPFINELDKEIIVMNETNSLIFNLIIKYFYTYDTSFLNEYKNDYQILLDIYFYIIDTKKDFMELFNPIIERILVLISPNEIGRDNFTEMINYLADHMDIDSHMKLICKYVDIIGENPNILEKKVLLKNKDAIKFFRYVGIDI